tara:strand:- start:1309 stop:2982 length:1674 start_codon:yes stop_codon:yes gene_type:complete
MNNFEEENNLSFQKIGIIERLEKSPKKIIMILCLIGIPSFFVRIVYAPFDIPILQDAQGYFWYAIDMSVLGEFPKNHVIFNNGWPSFLSIFFNFIGDENFLVYQNLQRFLGIIISSVTFISVYLLCTRFVGKTYALISCSIFAFEPKLILNSFLGTPESAYIFMISIMLWLFFSNKLRNIYISFCILGLISLIRYEGLLLIIPISIIFFVRYRNHKKDLLKYFMCIGIFLLIILPFSSIRNDTMGQDGLISHVSAGPIYLQKSVENNEFSYEEFIKNSIENTIKFLGWSQIPFLIFFAPLGIILVLKKIDFKIITLFLVSITILIPTFYAFGRGFEESKYLLPLYPIFGVFTVFSIKLFYEKISKKKFLTILIACLIIISSLIYLELKSIDYEHEREAYQIMMDISKFDMKINSDMGKNGYELGYIHWSKIHGNSEFPDIKSTFKFSSDISFLNINEYASELSKEYDVKNFILEYLLINEENGLTHLLIDKYNNKNNCNDVICFEEGFNYVFFNESEFPFLMKIYDSKDEGYNYHIKLFEIDYHQFEIFLDDYNYGE